MALSILLGVPLGVFAALRYNQWPDFALRMLSVLGVAVAAFWVAIMLQLLFAMQLGWLPLRGELCGGIAPPVRITGSLLLDSLSHRALRRSADGLAHLVLPAVTLALGGMASIVRFTRAGVLDTLQQDFVTYERAMGYRRMRLIWRYVLRNSVTATITQVGLLFGGLIAGGVVVEAIYDWPGIGSYTVNAILTGDHQVMLAVTLMIGVVYAVVNILTDLVHGLVDPRLMDSRHKPGPPQALRDLPAMFGLALVVLVLLVAIAGPWIAPYPADATASHLARRLKPPTGPFPFGTDNLGRDILSRVILGARGALTVAFTVVGLSMAIGIPLGLIAGYRAGIVSELIMRVTDVVLAIPQLVLALALAQLMSPSLESAMLALSLTYWPFFTRIVYAEARRLGNSVFVDALRGIGAGSPRIVFLHILPNAASPIIVRATIGLGFTILTAAVLGFLGMGATPPAPDWGLTIAQSRIYLPGAWWYALYPGLAILLTVMGFNLLGDGLRDLVDPRLRRSR